MAHIDAIMALPQPQVGAARAESIKLVDLRRAPSLSSIPGSPFDSPSGSRPATPGGSPHREKTPRDGLVSSAASSTAPILSRAAGGAEEDVEATSAPTSPSPHHTSSSELPPADEGYRAWTFLCGAFLIEVICLGPAFSFSVFQEYLTHSPFSPLGKVSNVSISAIGTVLTALIYFAPPCLRGIWSRYAPWNRWMGFGAIVMAALSLFVASFVNTVALLILFMGVIPGMALGMATVNYMVWLPQWFIKKRGLANGLAFSGAGTGGLIFPFLFNATLNQLDFHWTLRVWALCLIVVGGLAAWLIRPRLPLRSRNASSSRPMRPKTWKDRFSGFVYLLSPLWLSNALSTFAASVAFFSVSFYLATYCTSLGLSTTAATGAVAAFNGASLLGEITIGHACDRFSYSYIMMAIGIVGSLSAFLLFGLAQNLAGVMFFVLLYGWAVGSFCATWTPGAFDIARLRNMQTATVILSFTFVRGVASLIGPLIAASLYKPEENTHKAIFGSFGFDALIAFVGACMLAVSVFSAAIEVFRKMSFKGTDLATLQEHF